MNKRTSEKRRLLSISGCLNDNRRFSESIRSFTIISALYRYVPTLDGACRSLLDPCNLKQEYRLDNFEKQSLKCDLHFFYIPFIKRIQKFLKDKQDPLYVTLHGY